MSSLRLDAQNRIDFVQVQIKRKMEMFENVVTLRRMRAHHETAPNDSPKGKENFARL